MKHILLSFFLATSSLLAQSATEIAKAAVSVDQWQLVQAAMIEQRDALNATHTASLATLSADITSIRASSAKALDDQRAELTATHDAKVSELNASITQLQADSAKAKSDLAALQGLIKSTLDAKLDQLQAAYDAEIQAGPGPKSQAIKARMEDINELLTAAGKSPAQLAVEAAQAAADKAAAELAAAKAALNN